MWKRTRFLLLILPIISYFPFSPIFEYQKVSSLFSQGLRGTQSWNLVHTWTVDWCFMCTWIRLLVFIYSFISSIFFPSNSKTLNFLSLFSVRPTKLLLDSFWYTHGQRVDLLCTPNTISQNILVPLRFFFFLSLQLAKIRNLLLKNVSFAHSLLYFFVCFHCIKQYKKAKKL